MAAHCFLDLLGITHGCKSALQLVQGKPFCTTSQRTFRMRHAVQALEARFFRWAGEITAEAVQPGSTGTMSWVDVIRIMVVHP